MNYLNSLQLYKIFSDTYCRYQGTEKPKILIDIMEKSEKIAILGKELIYAPLSVFDERNRSMLAYKIKNGIRKDTRILFKSGISQCFVAFTVVANICTARVLMDDPIPDKLISSLYSYITIVTTTNGHNIIRTYQKVCQKVEFYIKQNNVLSHDIPEFLDSLTYQKILYSF